jgi:hypothetical protein
MEKQMDELKANMERSSMALSKFEKDIEVVNPDAKTNILSARLLQLNTEYTAAQAARIHEEARNLQTTSMRRDRIWPKCRRCTVLIIRSTEKPLPNSQRPRKSLTIPGGTSAAG